MFKIVLITLVLFTSSNAIWVSKQPRFTPIKPVPSADKCYTRSVARDTTTDYVEEGSISYYCKNTFTEPSSDSYIKSDTCTGATASDPGSVTFHERAWYLNLANCSEIDQSKDLDGKDIYYKDGIPYDKTEVVNGLYFDPYSGVLICESSYLQINNSLCIKPDWNNRNLADAILKRDKIARDNNLTDVSGIREDSITYTSSGAIESFSFSAINEQGGVEMIATSFKDDDPVFTVEDDGTITESEYDPNSGSSGTGGSGSSGGTDTGTDTGTDSGSSTTTGGVSTAEQSLSEINTKSGSIDASLSDIKETLNPTTLPSVENPLENVDTYYDDSIIPEVQELVTNFSNDFYSLKDTYTQKMDYIQSKGFSFDYDTTLYSNCPLNYELTVFENPMEITFDICEMMENATLPNSNLNMQVMFYTIFYTFFYAVILIGIFKFASITLRSF